MGVEFRHVLSVALVLSACQASNQSALVTQPQLHLAGLPDDCGAAALIDLRGQPFAAIAGRNLVNDLRIIRWNEAVTTEIEPRRINAMLDEKGLVLRFFCG